MLIIALHISFSTNNIHVCKTFCFLTRVQAIRLPLLKNMYLTTADLLLILNGWPLRTILFVTILSGFTECRLPVATNSCRPSKIHKINMEQ